MYSAHFESSCCCTGKWKQKQGLSASRIHGKSICKTKNNSIFPARVVLSSWFLVLQPLTMQAVPGHSALHPRRNPTRNFSGWIVQVQKAFLPSNTDFNGSLPLLGSSSCFHILQPQSLPTDLRPITPLVPQGIYD